MVWKRVMGCLLGRFGARGARAVGAQAAAAGQAPERAASRA